MSHLSPDEFVDAVDATLPPPRLRHLEQCDACRRELAALARVMHDAAEGPVPEPSPLFWTHFSARVRDAVRAEAAAPAGRSWSAWLRSSAVVPIGALGAIVVALVASMPYRGVAPEAPMVLAPAVSATELPAHEPSDGDAAWHALAELVGPLDWDVAGEAGLAIAPGDTERAVLDLSDDERRELSGLIAGELARAKS